MLSGAWGQETLPEEVDKAKTTEEETRKEEERRQKALQDRERAVRKEKERL